MLAFWKFRDLILHTTLKEVTFEIDCKTVKITYDK